MRFRSTLCCLTLLFVMICPPSPAAGVPESVEASIRQKLRELRWDAANETAWACLHSATETLRREAHPAAEEIALCLRKLEREGMPLHVDPRSWAESRLQEHLGRNRASAFRRQWSALEYRLDRLDARSLYAAERDAVGAVPAAEAQAGYDPAVRAVNPRVPHTMHALHNYIRHRSGGYLLGGLRAGNAAVEFHAGPLGLALRSLRSRGYSRFHRFTAPGTDDRVSDGFYLAFRMTDGEALVFHAGAFGQARLQQAQLFLHLAGIPGERVSRWLHEYPLERLFTRLNPPLAGPDDLAGIGFSRGPIRALQAREEARRGLEILQKSGIDSPVQLAQRLGCRPEELPADAAVLSQTPADLLRSGALLVRWQKLRAWLASRDRAVPIVRLLPSSPPVFPADRLDNPFLLCHRLRVTDEAGRRFRLLLLGSLWGDLARVSGERLAALGYRRVMFLGIAGGLGEKDRLGELHRATRLMAPDGRSESLSGWLPSLPADVRDRAVDLNVISPLVETRPWLETARRHGATTVEMEALPLWQGLQQASPPPALECLLVISDVPGRSGETLESRYQHRDAVQDGVSRALDLLLGGINAIRLEGETETLPRAPRRIGLMTGTFDPMHVGHLALARQAVIQGGLDRLDLIPNPEPSHKEMASPYRVRLEMTALTIRHDPRLQLVGGPRYRLAYLRGGTDAMIRLWRQENAGAQDYYQVMGGDSFLKLAEKKEIFHEAAARNRFLVCPREGEEETAAILAAAATLPPGRIQLLSPVPIEGLSSTKIRQRLSRGLSVDGLTDPRIGEAVERWKLYRIRSVPFTRRLLEGKKL